MQRGCKEALPCHTSSLYLLGSLRLATGPPCRRDQAVRQGARTGQRGLGAARRPGQLAARCAGGDEDKQGRRSRRLLLRPMLQHATRIGLLLRPPTTARRILHSLKTLPVTSSPPKPSPLPAPQRLELLYLRAICHHALGHFRQAVVDYDTVFSMKPREGQGRAAAEEVGLAPRLAPRSCLLSHNQFELSSPAASLRSRRCAAGHGAWQPLAAQRRGIDINMNSSFACTCLPL
jgi:hypothetical protein